MTGFRALRALTLAVLSCLLLCAPAQGQDVVHSAAYPPPPADNVFVVDTADLVSERTEGIINERAAKLLAEKHIPVYVVTVHSLSAQNAGGLTIERYARNLFDQWGIGFKDYNYGILLLVCKDDRRARIELGASWPRSQDPCFINYRVHCSGTRAGVLIYISLLERMVWVVPDDAVAAQMPPEAWSTVRDTIIAGFAQDWANAAAAIAGAVHPSRQPAATVIPRPARTAF
jgi:hypothetical protein